MGNHIKRKKISYIPPEGFVIVNIVTCYVELKKTCNLKQSVDRLAKLVFSHHNGAPYDIMCVQGIKDKVSYDSFTNKIGGMDDSLCIFPFSKNNNVIISRHPVISTITSEHSTNTNDPSIIGININLNNNIISVFNTELNPYEYIKKESNIRKKEFAKVFNVIDENRKEIAKDEYSNYIKPQINILAGMFYIPTVVYDDINPPFKFLLRNYKVLDIYGFLKSRYMADYRNHKSYIFFPMSQNDLKKVNNKKDLSKNLLDNYGIHFIHSSYIDWMDILDKKHTPLMVKLMIRVK